MKVRILDFAQEHLIEAYHFYEEQSPALGEYFLDSLYSDIDSLVLYAGVHPRLFGFHRALSKRFPFGIYYLIEGDEVRVHAVLDCRRKPSWIRRRIKRARGG